MSISENMFVMLSGAKYLKILQPLPSLREVPLLAKRGVGRGSMNLLEDFFQIYNQYHEYPPALRTSPLPKGGLFQFQYTKTHSFTQRNFCLLYSKEVARRAGGFPVIFNNSETIQHSIIPLLGRRGQGRYYFFVMLSKAKHLKNKKDVANHIPIYIL